jgi:hypothetical protein
MQPGDSVDHYFEVRTPAGVAVTGLVTADFTFTAWHTPYGGTSASWTHGAAVTELAAGRYRVRFALPATAGAWGFYLTHATHIVTPVGWEDELETYDLDAIAAIVAKPVVRLQGSGTLGEAAAVPDLIAFRKAILTLSVLDGNGDPYDFTGWANFAVGFRSPSTQSGGAPRLDAVHGTPTGFAMVVSAGLITLTIPDDLSIFSAITEGATPVDSVEVDMEVVGDSPSGQTISIVAPSRFRILKRAHGSGSP